MKILCIGDQHFKYELSYASAIQDGRRGEWEAVKKTLHDTAKTCDAVVLMGDNFNARHNHSSVIREFVDFLNGFGDVEVHILAGNHERYGTSTALDFLQNIKHKNWFVYTEPKLSAIGKTPVAMIPFMTPALLGVETKEEGVKLLVKKFFPKEPWALAFVHHGVTDATIQGLPMDFLNEIILPREKLEKSFDHIFAGHIHDGQKLSEQTYMTGNIFTNEVGEHTKSALVYESVRNKVTITEVPMPVRGIYKLDWNDDPKKIFGGIPASSIVKCVVTKRGTDIDLVEKTLKRFDASLIIEQYPNERSKVHFESGLDLSIDSLLKMYAEAKKLEYADLKEGFELIKV